MEIIQKEISVFAKIEGADFKGAVEIKNGKLVVVEMTIQNKDKQIEFGILSEEQLRSLTQELVRIVDYLDMTDSDFIEDVEFAPAPEPSPQPQHPEPMNPLKEDWEDYI